MANLSQAQIIEVGTRDGIGGDFLAIFMDFGLRFELRNREKTIKNELFY